MFNIGSFFQSIFSQPSRPTQTMIMSSKPADTMIMSSKPAETMIMSSRLDEQKAGNYALDSFMGPSVGGSYPSLNNTSPLANVTPLTVLEPLLGNTGAALANVTPLTQVTPFAGISGVAQITTSNPFTMPIGNNLTRAMQSMPSPVAAPAKGRGARVSNNVAHA